MKKILLGLLATMFSFQSQATVFEKDLDNGLHILVKPDHRAPIAECQIWYKVGSSDEPTGLTGISHMLEHMMFKGTTHHQPGQYSRIIAANGGRDNAETSDDYTVYYQSLAAKNLPVCFELESDRMQNLIFNENEFKQENKVVQEERHMRMDDKPQSLTYERFMASAHVDGPYHHMTIGWPSDIAQLSLEDMKSWYKKWYAPNNATLVVVGDVEPEKVFALAQQHFAAIPKRPIEITKHYEPIENLGERRVEVNVPAKLPIILMGYNVPSLRSEPNNPDAYALLVTSSILGGSDSSRLQTELMRKNSLATSIGSDYDIYAKYDTLFMLEAIPSNDKQLLQLENALKNEIQKLQTTLVTPDELARVKSQVLSNKIYSLDSLSAQARILGNLLTVGLPWQESMTYSDKINAITAEDIQRVAKKYLSTKNLTVATLKPLSSLATASDPTSPAESKTKSTLHQSTAAMKKKEDSALAIHQTSHTLSKKGTKHA